MEKITIHDLADGVSKKHRLGKKAVEQFISDMFNVISNGLDTDELVKVKGLGSFKVTTVKPRESINIKTGERHVIEQHAKVSFTADATMRERINKPFAHFETVPLKDGVTFSDMEEDLKSSAQSTVSDDEFPEEPLVETGNEVISENIKTELDADAKTADGETDASFVGEEIIQEEGSSTVNINSQDCEQTPSAQVEDTKPSDDLSNGDVESNDTEDETHDNSIVDIVALNGATSSSAEKLMLNGENEESEDVNVESQIPRVSRRSWLFHIPIYLLMLAAGLLIGYFIWGHNAGTIANESLLSKDVAATSVDSMANVANASKDTLKTPKDANVFNFDAVNGDKRLQYGAYHIVGIDTVITLREGQTMASYCRATLGADMLVYFQVLNGVDELTGGQKLKVPKVKLKKQK